MLLQLLSVSLDHEREQKQLNYTITIVMCVHITDNMFKPDFI